ncbi:ferritin-like domain-containing protein [Pseudogracilibacillus sp. SE30717A]|uniref:Dps family protein n=1 Tax=Pseudogracilibacillus sp. SE30717A TaxID=3098293 RepID=UPI00300E416C
MDRQKLILFLNQLLANYFVIYVKLHRYQWFSKGEHVFQLQPFFQELHSKWKEDIDLLAEHILTMDGKPYATMIKYVKEATIDEATADDEEEEMILQLSHDLSKLYKEIEEIGLKRAKDINDELTAHLLFSFQQKLSKIIWRCKAYYK